MQKHLPGFDIAKLLREIEHLMVPHAGTKVMRSITIHGDMLQVKLENDHKGEEDDALIFDEDFIRIVRD